MEIHFAELSEPLREGGLEKATADMAHYLSSAGVNIRRGTNTQIAGSADLVHFHGLWSPVHYKLARFCRDHDIPTVVSPHGMLEPWAWRHRRWKKWPYFHLFEKKRMGWASALLATAEEERSNLERFFPQTRIHTLPLGIEPNIEPDYEQARKTLGWEQSERVLLYLSRVHPKKGLKELLEALISLPLSILDNVRLVIVGDGPKDYMRECHRLSGQLPPAITVNWVAPKWGEAKWPYLQGADLFCLPTYSENFGIVVLEAGIVGTPVFTTTGTPWKVIEREGFGWVPDPSPESYANVLEAFLKLPKAELRQMRSRFSLWTRTHYSWPNLIQRYIDFYGDLRGLRQDA